MPQDAGAIQVDTPLAELSDLPPTS
jgi:hypothetical protein